MLFRSHRRHRIRKKAIIGYVQRVLKGEKQWQADISVIFIDGRYCKYINRRYLAHGYSTDVISFTLEEGENLEGEIYVNLDRARQQAHRYRVPFANEIARLVVHGALHIMGYDERNPAEAARMKARENGYLALLFREHRI